MAAHIVLLGPPASGKGTQGRRLASSLGLAYLSTGALLREVMEGDSDDAKIIRPILARGGYIPDDMMCRIITDWLGQHQEGWVIDGFPRTLAQADFLDEWLKSEGLKLDAALALSVSKDELIQRIKDRVECKECRWGGHYRELSDDANCPVCGGEAGPRADDTLENFLSRYEKYCEHTIPLIDRYRNDGILVSSDASMGIEEVATEIHQRLQLILNNGQTS